MKYLIAFFLLTGIAFATEEVLEVGSTNDCVVLGDSVDRKEEGLQTDLQQKVLDCLSPSEEETVKVKSQKGNELVSQ